MGELEYLRILFEELKLEKDYYTVKKSLEDLKQRLQNKETEKQKYLNIANDIKKVYDTLAEYKGVIKEQKNSVKIFSCEDYARFKGYLYSNGYMPVIENLIDSYDTVIENIDTNMDQLNKLRGEYENKAYSCDGIIGYIRSMVNTLMHIVQNWVN